MKKVVHFGPGNIGLGFFGQIYYESGYEIVFVGRNREKIDLLNSYGEYPLMLSGADGNVREMLVKNVRAIEYLDEDNLKEEISSADLISTSVGPANLADIAGPLARGLMARWAAKNFSPVNVLLGENMVDTDKYFTGLVEKELGDPDLIRIFRETVGIVDTSVERLVPVTTEEMREGHPLRTWASDSLRFPVDKDAFRGEIPPLKYMMLTTNFEFYKKRKIFVFNSGHSTMAYLGHVKGYDHMSQAYRDAAIVHAAYHAMLESASALCREFQVPPQETVDRIKERLNYWGNLDDEITRVGRDPLRKLSDNERFIGGAKLAVKHGMVPLYLCLAAGAALHFDSKDDASCQRMRKMVAEGGPQSVLREVSKIDEGSRLWQVIMGFYNLLEKRKIL
ncbi:MAG TPA: hypothetical protein GXX30_00180 [Firmicutes bacterium]|nr:hypothetical protein [Candidatus Fermentithermobacillaceae bacterium]